MNALACCLRSARHSVLLLTVSTALSVELMAAPATAQDLRLVPFPKSVTLQPGAFSLADPLVLELAEGQDAHLASLLNSELERAGLRPVQLTRVTFPSPAFRLSAAGERPALLPAVPQQTETESYALEVRPNEIVCAARDGSGLFYGLQTLCQLIRANRQEANLPCVQVRDWPALRWRAFQDDMTRGPSSTLDTLKFEASLASYLKLNLMTYYMEYQFAFKKHPRIGPPDGSLTPEELAALVKYVKPLHIDVLGNQQSFGHFGQILRHPEYAALRETAHILTPVREETYRLLDDFYSEVCPVLPFPWFNVCCDETEGLGTGPSSELAARIGVGGVYVSHIRRVHDLLRDKHQKRMMMWGDIILQHPDKLSEVPKDTIMLTWGYDARLSFEHQIIPFAKAGYEFFVCPGVNDWSRILPDFGAAVTNIQNFVRDGIKHGAMGMINTDWQDDGEALKAVKWHADAWAAECAWNASTTPIHVFNRRVGAVLFGERGDAFGQAVECLAQTRRMPAMKGMFNSRFWEKDFVPQAKGAAIQARASNLLAVVRPAIEHLETCRQQAVCSQHVLDVFLLGSRRMELIGQRMLDGVEAVGVYERVRSGAAPLSELAAVESLLKRNRDAHEQIGRQFAALWLSEAKPYALDWTLRRYTNAVQEFDSLLNKLQSARSAALEGQPLPPPDELGLAAPRPVSRRTRPERVLSTPLEPDLPWIEQAATHRIGLVISAGVADRFDLPVEVELPLPADLAARHVRAFRVGTDEPPRELLAQLEPAGSQSNSSRLFVILPGPLARGTEATVQVYLGFAQAPPALPAAVSTSPAAHGMRWIENDHVRLLLGPEGAHVYRWEVKGADGRDLTMPGESGWAGFCDINTHRSSAYALNCTARGPALVEYECIDADGQTKTIRLYGGASWIEVFLDAPVPTYWDFDDPRNFAADGPAPGQFLFSNGQSDTVGREADGVPAQVKAPHTYWGIKFNPDHLALGLVTPETAALHVIAPGSGAGGVGIEGSPPAAHFVTFAGLLQASPAETMNRLRSTLDLRHPVAVRLHAIQSR